MVVTSDGTVRLPRQTPAGWNASGESGGGFYIEGSFDPSIKNARVNTFPLLTPARGPSSN